jgi:hypothetical protein
MSKAKSLADLNEVYVPLHTHAVDPRGRRTCYQPGLVNAFGLRLLIKALDFLHDEAVNLVRWELSQTGKPLNFTLGALGSAPSGQAEPRSPRATSPDPCTFAGVAKELTEMVKQAPVSKNPRGPSPCEPLPPGRPVSVCVIDDGCNFASAALDRSGDSVVPELLVQAAEAEALTKLDNTEKYTPGLNVVFKGSSFDFSGILLGRRLDTRQFRTASDTDGPDLSCEPAVYRATDYLHPTPSGRHGAAVLDLIANRRLWIDTHWFSRCAPPKVHFVQLPVPTVVDTSGNSLSAQVLAAIHEALFRADACSDILLNLSFGNHSGPHDGTSMIECAIVELLKLYDGCEEAAGKRLIVVLPAGNSHLLRCHAQGHACRERPSAIDWKVMPDDDTDNFVEIWLPRGRVARVKVTAPDGIMADLQVGPKAAQDFKVNWTDEKGNKFEPADMLFYANEPPQSCHAALLLLAVQGNRALSQDPERFLMDFKLDYLRSKDGKRIDSKFGEHPNQIRKAQPPRHGIWRIELTPDEGPDAAPIPWQAYVQRGDVAPLRRRSARGVFGRQSYIMDNCESQAEPMFTLNGIATASHERLFVVGAMERADGRLSPYSAAGPRVPPALDPARIPPADDCRVGGPCWVVPADESRRRHGLLVGGVLGGSHLRMSGTSMAAATLTRHLWEHLHAGHPLESFRGPAPCEEPAPTKIPVEAPEYACDLHRGEAHRILSTRPDGSL